MMKAIAFLALTAATAVPAQAIELNGTWQGTVTSGTNMFETNGVPTTEDLTGGMGSIIVQNQDDDEGTGTAEIFVGPVSGGEGGAFGPGGGTVVQAANGVFRIDVIVPSNFSNDSAIARLTADIVNKQLVNWRGQIEAEGQTTGTDSWELLANFDTLTFTGTYSGPIPEPASWAMMIAGFGLAGAALRRRPQGLTARA